MNKQRCEKNMPQKGQKGAVLVLVTLCLIILIGFVALAIDVGYMYTTRNELQNVADAAALAGARYLGEVYIGLDPSQQGTWGFTENTVEDKIDTAAYNNTAANVSIHIDKTGNPGNGDIAVGLWDVTVNDDDVYTETWTGPDAVRVIARRDTNINSPITTFLARIFNFETANITSEKAVAALTGPQSVEPGELKTPFGISEHWFPDHCDDTINFSPTTSSCAGWHNFFDAINADAMEAKLYGFIQGDSAEDYPGLWDGATWMQTNFGISPAPEETPPAEGGDEFLFQGGDITKLFTGSYIDYDAVPSYAGNQGTVVGSPANKPAAIRALFDYFRFRDGDGHDEYWTTTVPVYQDNEDGTCINPNTNIPILGFATIRVLTVNPQDLGRLLIVDIDCTLRVIDGRGGGNNYGSTKGKIPNLVR
jgi:Flp pilus assembly protein TadG